MFLTNEAHTSLSECGDVWRWWFVNEGTVAIIVVGDEEVEADWRRLRRRWTMAPERESFLESNNFFQLLLHTHINQFRSRISIPDCESSNQRLINHRLHPHILRSSEFLHLFRDLRQVLFLKLHHRRYHRQLRLRQVIVHQLKLLHDLLKHIDPLPLNQSVEKITDVCLDTTMTP